MMKKYFVCDIDGTLVNISVRQKFLMGEKKDWVSFRKDYSTDFINVDIAILAHILIKAGYELIICTGRLKSELQETEKILGKAKLKPKFIFMRDDGDHRPDNIIKVEMLKHCQKMMGGNPDYWIDDRQRVCKAIRQCGIRVLQVDNGDF